MLRIFIFFVFWRSLKKYPVSYLTIEASVKIEILNGLGKVLKVIENNKLNARTYLYHCPAKSLSSGIYFMRVLINNNIKISKLVVE